MVRLQKPTWVYEVMSQNNPKDDWLIQLMNNPKVFSKILKNVFNYKIVKKSDRIEQISIMY